MSEPPSLAEAEGGDDSEDDRSDDRRNEPLTLTSAAHGASNGVKGKLEREPKDLQLMDVPLMDFKVDLQLNDETGWTLL